MVLKIHRKPKGVAALMEFAAALATVRGAVHRRLKKPKRRHRLRTVALAGTAIAVGGLVLAMMRRGNCGAADAGSATDAATERETSERADQGFPVDGVEVAA